MKNIKLAKRIIFVLALLPIAWLVRGFFLNELGANPIEYLLHELGAWTLRFLVLTLSITPLRKITGKAYFLQFRRMFGLYTFFYACCHFLVYLVLDQFFDWSNIIADVTKRPYITVGFTALVLLTPLAITSTNKMMRRLGKRWKKLHRIVYLIAILGVVHYYWLVKADIQRPLIYGAIFTLLFAIRIYYYSKSRLKKKI